jgi:Domain of unknown function (DUF4406)
MSKMLLVYIGGPFRSRSTPYNHWEQEQNVRQAEELALQVWKLGAVAIAPHSLTRFWQGALPDETWLEGDLEILSRCDAMLLVPGWEQSAGTRAEVAYATHNFIPVYHSLAQVVGFLQETYETDRDCATTAR